MGNNIQLNNEILQVVDINLQFENIDLNSEHQQKIENSIPKYLFVAVIITVKNIGKE